MYGRGLSLSPYISGGIHHVQSSPFRQMHARTHPLPPEGGRLGVGPVFLDPRVSPPTKSSFFVYTDHLKMSKSDIHKYFKGISKKKI